MHASAAVGHSIYNELILVDAENPHSVQLRQLGDQDAQERGRVYDKVRRVILCVETCQEVAAKQKGFVKKKKDGDELLFFYGCYKNVPCVNI